MVWSLTLQTNPRCSSLWRLPAAWFNSSAKDPHSLCLTREQRAEMGYRPNATKTRKLSLWHGSTAHVSPCLHPHPASCRHARTLHTWGTEARRSEKTAHTVWDRKVLVAFHCSRVFQSGPKAVVYQPWSKATVPVVVYKTESYLSFLQLCTQYNLPHAPLSFLLLSYFVVTFVKGPWKYYAALLYI